MARGWKKFIFGEMGDVTKKSYEKPVYASTLKQNGVKLEDLVKEGETLAEQKTQRENNLVWGYEHKKLKSERLIAEAKSIIKKRESKAKKQETATATAKE